MSQRVKVERKKIDEKIVNEKSKSLVGLKEKLLCLSIEENYASKQVKVAVRSFGSIMVHTRFDNGIGSCRRKFN